MEDIFVRLAVIEQRQVLDQTDLDALRREIRLAGQTMQSILTLRADEAETRREGRVILTKMLTYGIGIAIFALVMTGTTILLWPQSGPAPTLNLSPEPHSTEWPRSKLQPSPKGIEGVYP